MATRDMTHLGLIKDLRLSMVSCMVDIWETKHTARNSLFWDMARVFHAGTAWLPWLMSCNVGLDSQWPRYCQWTTEIRPAMWQRVREAARDASRNSLAEFQTQPVLSECPHLSFWSLSGGENRRTEAWKMIIGLMGIERVLRAMHLLRGGRSRCKHGQHNMWPLHSSSFHVQVHAS